MIAFYIRGASIMQDIYTPDEIADKLKVTRLTVYRWIEKGELKAFKAGKMWRITREDLEAFLGRTVPWK